MPAEGLLSLSTASSGLGMPKRARSGDAAAAAASEAPDYEDYDQTSMTYDSVRQPIGVGLLEAALRQASRSATSPLIGLIAPRMTRIYPCYTSNWPKYTDN